MAEFDYYEFRGVITPGAVLVVGVVLLFPAVTNLGGGQDFSLGEFGVFLVASYVAGHLLQSVANLLEGPYWKLRGGWPSAWVRNGTKRLVAGEQRAVLPDAIERILGLRISTLEGVGEREWDSIIRQMKAALEDAERNRRVEVFNSNYGLFRGLVVAFLIDSVLVALVRHWEGVPMIALLIVSVALALQRMDRFARHYSRELVAQFLQLARKTGDP
jgi:hypothetical protein